MPEFLEIETPHRLLRISEIKMFHAKAVARWRGIVAAAHEKMGGAGAGIGFVGSPEWVVTGSLILGAIESAISSSNAKIGLKLLGEAGTFMQEMQERSIFIPVNRIAGIQSPKPETWHGENDGISFISLGEDFLRVRTVDNVEMCVRWSAVSSMRIGFD